MAGISIQFVMKPEHRAALERGWQPKHGRSFINSCDRVLAEHNWPDVVEQGQTKWKPLSPKYVAQKEAQGYSPRIWERKETTADSLKSHQPIRSEVTVIGTKVVTMTQNSGAMIAAEWSVQHEAGPRIFARNAAIRPIMVVTEKAAGKITQALKRIVYKMLHECGMTVRGAVLISAERDD